MSSGLAIDLDSGSDASSKIAVARNATPDGDIDRELSNKGKVKAFDGDSEGIN